MKCIFIGCAILVGYCLHAQPVKNTADSIPPMLEVKKDGVNLNGSIRIRSLAGKGKKQVWVNDSGILETDTGPVTESVSHFYNVGPGSFIRTNPTSSYLFYNQVYRAFISTGSAETLAAPVNLPHGATVTSIRAIFFDNTDQDLQIRFLMTRIGLAGTYILSTINTTGTGTAERTLNSYPLAYSIDNDNEFYTVSVSPVTGDTWMNSLMYIKAIVFTYEL